MKKLLFIIYFLSVGFIVYAGTFNIFSGGSGTVRIGSNGSGTVTVAHQLPPSYPDITFYDKMDSSTTGRAPTKGSGTLTITGDTIMPGAALSSSSTASLNGTTDNGFKRVTVSTSGNIDYSQGRAGFYFVWDTATNDSSNAFGWQTSGDTTPRFAFRKFNSGNSWVFKYEDVGVSQALVAGTTYYVEVAWDHNKTNGYCAELRIDGGSYTTSNACSTSVPSNSTFGLLGDSIGSAGHSMKGRMDEVIISSNSQRDLYAIRDLGNYSN